MFRTRFASLALMVTLLMPVAAIATVDMLAANNITRELYVFDEDDYVGFGWNVVAGEPADWEREEERYTSAGYVFAESPYRLEWGGGLAVVFAVFIFWFIRNGMNLLRRF